MQSTFKLAMVLAIAGFLFSANAQTISDINKLSAKLLEGYNKDTLPSNSQHKAFEIKVSAFLVDLGELDEINEKLTTVMVLTLYWRDESMVWNSTENNISAITVHQEKVWVPKFRLKNMHSFTSDGPKEKDMDKVVFFPDGTALFFYFKLFHSVCDLDTTKYPFDKQTCKIQLHISGYILNKFHMDVGWSDDLLGIFTGDGVWEVINNTITGNDESSGVEITFVFKRKHLYILLNVILPIATLVFLTPSVFLLPNDRGERIGFAITTLLSISVYMTIVGSHLPANSDPMPLLSILLFVWYVMTGVIVFIVILNLNINARNSESPVSATAKRLVKFRKCFSKKKPSNPAKASVLTSLKCCLCGGCLSNFHTYDVRPCEVSKPELEASAERTKDNCESNEEAGSSADSVHCEVSAASPSCSSKQDRITWQDVSETIDIVAMVLIYSVDFLVTLLYIIACI